MLRLLFLLPALVAGLAAAERPPVLLLLHNTEVPLGAELAQGYATARGLSANCIIGLALPTDEVMPAGDFRRLAAEPVLAAIRNSSPPAEAVLAFYGVPVFVKDGDRLRAFDRLLSLARRDMPPGARLVENPFFHRVVEPRDDLPLPVLRLDAPTPGAARAMLAAWLFVGRHGPWKRWLPDPAAPERAQILREAALMVPAGADPALIPPGEIQYLEAGTDLLRRLPRTAAPGSLAAGAMVVLAEGGNAVPAWTPLRSDGLGAASAATLAGAGFFLGRQAPRQEEMEDHFDTTHFLERLLSGESFLEASHGALAHLGGSFLIIGDPLGRPFAPETAANLKAFYESGQVTGAQPEELRRMAEMKHWWLLREILQDWQEGRFELARVKMQGASAVRRDLPLYHEVLAGFLLQLGDTRRLQSLLAAFPAAGSPYYEAEVRRLSAELRARQARE